LGYEVAGFVFGDKLFSVSVRKLKITVLWNVMSYFVRFLQSVGTY